jgi:nucleolin
MRNIPEMLKGKFEEAEEEPMEIEPQEEPIEIESTEEKPTEKEVTEEERSDELVEEGTFYEEWPVRRKYLNEELPLKKRYKEKDLSKETREKLFEVGSKEHPNKIVSDKQEYQRTSMKPANYENHEAGNSRQLQDRAKNYGSSSSKSCDKDKDKVWNEQDRPDQSQPGTSKGEIDPFTLYVWNIPMSFDREGLEELFSKFGPINEITVPQDDYGLNNGYGFVEFSNAADAASAVAPMNGHIMKGMPMEVEIKGVKSETRASILGRGARAPDKTKLLVKNLPLDMTRIDLIKTFQDFGDIATAYLVKNKLGSKVYGYVIFSTPESAAEAMACRNRHRIGANKLQVSIASGAQTAKEIGSRNATILLESSQPRQDLPDLPNASGRKRARKSIRPYKYEENSKKYKDDEAAPSGCKKM